ncbi:hypothetical protein FP2506_18519 [Fulvimarina pelagi HTCC2506]|uniref:Uncharacterized protein n=1 Tax=Fulvimarina pelagi HTCC2506 TaxID=314231 RepID=Q0G0S9_9HYPH|nr:hypothetical protein [Fulvimarina pelagi]EAU40910.1 hypothetical protein FP2506_18519 [Fulvimarina pelagi HTCC2506]
MDATRRYKVKSPDEKAFKAVERILEIEARVVLTNPRRNTVAVTGLTDRTADKLRALHAKIQDDFTYDLE